MTDTQLRNIVNAKGLTAEDKANMQELMDVFNKVQKRNETLTKYYNEDITAKEKNLDISVDQKVANLPDIDIRSSWPAKVVEVLQARSKFDTFWHKDQSVKAIFDQIINENKLKIRYNKALLSELIHGCSFATLSMGANDRAQIRFHSAQTSAAIWDPYNETTACGFTIVDTARYNNETHRSPSVVNLYTPTHIVVLNRVGLTDWTATYYEQKMGRPLMVPMVYRATDAKPFGKSRITNDVRSLTDSNLRERLRLEIASEFFTTPQKYINGLLDETAVAMAQQKIKNYMSCMMLLTRDPNSGEKAEIGQLDPTSMTPHKEVLEMWAQSLASTSCIPCSELGIVRDQPSSAEAITLEKEPLILEAQDLNANNGETLKECVLMAYAMNEGLSWGDIPYEITEIQPHFENPAYPTIVSQADAVVKLAAGSSTPFGKTVSYWASCGYDDIETQQILSQMDENETDALLTQVLTSYNTNNNKMTEEEIEVNTGGDNNQSRA